MVQSPSFPPVQYSRPIPPWVRISPSSTVIYPGPTCFHPVRSLPSKSCFHSSVWAQVKPDIAKRRQNRAIQRFIATSKAAILHFGYYLCQSRCTEVPEIRIQTAIIRKPLPPKAPAQIRSLMSTKIKTAILVASAGLLLFSLAGGIGGVRASNDGSYRQMEVYSEVLSRVRSEYVEEPNLPSVTDGALHGLLESLDSNSSYLNPEQYKDYKARKTSSKGDIGAAVSKRFGYASIVSVIPGGPADKAGLQDTDIIEAIENKSTREMSLAEIRSLLAGDPGSNLNLSVVRARRAEPQKVVITRVVVNIPAAQDKMLQDGIGEVHVDALTKGKSQEIASKIKALQKSGAKKLILDLRDCA